MIERLATTLTVLNGTSVSQMTFEVDATRYVDILIVQLLSLHVPGETNPKEWTLLANGIGLDPNRTLAEQLPMPRPARLELVLVSQTSLQATTHHEIDLDSESSGPPSEMMRTLYGAESQEPAKEEAAPARKRMTAPAPPAPITTSAPRPPQRMAPAPSRASAPAASVPARSAGGLLPKLARSFVEGKKSISDEPTQRQAAVRYYRRMNPQRVFPMLVTISTRELATIIGSKVVQTTSETFVAETGSLVEVEPMLPGCLCYPERAKVKLSAVDSKLTFYIVPQVLGTITGGQVTLRQNDQILAVVPLEAKVRQRSWVLVTGILTFLLPFVSMLLKKAGLDFESQMKEDFGLYWQIGQFLFNSLSPITLAGILAVITGVFFLFTRPSQGDVFWDLAEAPATGG